MQYYHHPKNHSQIGYHYHIGNVSSCEPHKLHKPPINCTESDIHWIWSKKLEERRGHYVDSKKSRKFYVTCTLDSNDKQITNFSKAFRPGSCGKMMNYYHYK